MPPRARSPASKNLQPQYPAADTTTFRDLLLFEERLKRNAGLLKRRKRRYQLYLTLLLSTVLVLLSDVLLETDLFILPLNTGLSYYYTYGRPYIYGPNQIRDHPLATQSPDSHSRNVYDYADEYEHGHINAFLNMNPFSHGGSGDEKNVYYPPYPKFKTEEEVYLHLPQYVKTAGLFILGMTLFLFFASGMYSEKVGYANKYVPHANKSLRSFNMYLNVRTAPLPSRLSRMASKIGLSFLFPAPPPPSTQPSSPTQSTSPPMRMRTRSLSPPFSSRSSSPNSNLYQPNWNEINPIIPQIPPSTNPRGELIFSSRVHATFREAYERYRENYERKRSGGNSSGTIGSDVKLGGKKSILDRLRHPFGSPLETPGSGTPGADTPTAEPPGLPGTPGSPPTLRGRTSTNTPSGSRRSSPAPGSLGKKGSKRAGKGRISRQGTPLLEIAEALGTVQVGGGGSSSGGFVGEVGSGMGEGEGYAGGMVSSELSVDPTALVEVPSLGSVGPEVRRRPTRARKGSGRFE